MRLKLPFLLFFVYSFTWSQITFSPPSTTAGTFKVPAGVTSLSVECWGAGGGGGGVTSTLASLWAGGGGGGGAYSKVIALTVTPASTLNYKVGDGGTGFSGANNGADGEQTFFSTVVANGGAGGKFGNPTLGAGGAGGAASGTGIKYSGGNGATAALLSVVSINSGGGGGGAGTTANGGNTNNATGGTAGVSGGGAGADGVLAVGDGKDGATPGGGGSGAASLLSLGATRKGGNGGNGKLNVVYTCPTYGLTSATTADDLCLTAGTTTLVRLTGGASLPNGDYVVTYSRTNPNAAGLTATMSVTGGTGTGTFTAVGLNIAGTSTITVTNLTSEACTNTTSTFNTVTINVYAASIGGTIDTPAAICSGNTSGLLTLSGHTGSVVKWQYAVSPFSTWTDILTATTNTFTSDALTQTTQFRAVVKNGVCDALNSAATTVTVNPSPTIATTGIANTICYNVGAQTATLPYTATTNTPINYSITWNAAANTAGLVNQGGTAFGFSSGGGNLNTIVIPAGVPANTYSGNMTILNANCSVTQPIQITINALSVGGTIDTPAAICSGNTSGLLTLSDYTGTITGWESSVAPFSSWTPIANTINTYTSGTLTQTTQFRAIVKNGVCDAVNSATTTVTVNPLPTIATTGTLDNICFNTGVQTATLPYSATTNTPLNYSIIWNAAANTAGLVNQGVTAFAFSSGGGNLNTIEIPAGVAANTYSGVMTIQNVNCSVTQLIQLTIVPKPSEPIPGTVTEPTCVTSTGSVTLSGLPASVTWIIKQIGTVSTTYTGTGTTYNVSNLIPGNYAFTVEYVGSCISTSSASVIVNNLVTNSYTNTGWSNGSPTINQNLIFASNYTTTGGGLENINGCTCVVNSGINVVISSDDTLTINKAIVNNGGTLTFENNASLVQIANVANTGNIIYKRISKPMKNFDFTCWASPVTGQTLFNLSPNTLSDKYLSYTATGWKTEPPITTVMIPGKGYGIRTPKAKLWPNGENVVFPYSQPVQFIGVPNNGNISGGAVVAGITYLIGNPYPSAIDADAFLFENPNNSAILEGIIYFWTHNTDISLNGGKYSSADYASYNGIGGTMTLPAASGGSVPNGKIAAGQSFFAKATNNGSVVFNNEMRISGDNHHFFKPAKSSKSNAFERHRLWLNMTNTGGAFKQLLIGYIQGATNGFDSDFDGVSLNANLFIDFYSINLGSNLVIQGRALPFTDSDLVPLGYSTIIEGEFTISIGQADGKLGNQPVYLEDKLTNTINDLRESDYTFKTKTGIFNNRFVLRYTNKTLGIDDFESDNNVLVWIDNKNIRLHSAKENINKVFIYDVLGRLIYNDSAISAPEVIISNLKFKDEVLLAKIVLMNNHIITKKIITTSK
ncbi:glycine-rich domain-containing protein [Flavobacterium chungangense]|uniref:Glycine-rich domain-containing protein n=1 Tax=Flavobacterium chungangense TaxID=554283 RepID=A0A6V6YM53_9FLAO|nr:T9SS sorting signal type C domain-containing protein [Flavobacterium chungangense]CAD0000414.1 hypothetical protein FLACHUCJ7_00030 [Flavobacterium chungangense]